MEKVFECTTRKNKNGVEKVVGKMEIKNSSSTTAELFIYGDIVRDEWYKWSDDDTCPTDITNFLKDLNNFDNLNININSGGGSVYGGLAIYNQLKRHKGCKTAHVDGISASIATVITCAADKIIIPTSSQFMIHKPSISLWDSMNANELRKEADNLDVCEESILNVYMDKVKDGITKDQIRELVNAETWFTGETVTDYFDFETEESNEAVASASMFYSNYIRTPERLKNKSFFNAQNPKNEPKIHEMSAEIKEMSERINKKALEWGIK